MGALRPRLQCIGLRLQRSNLRVQCGKGRSALLGCHVPAFRVGANASEDKSGATQRSLRDDRHTAMAPQVSREAATFRDCSRDPPRWEQARPGRREVACREAGARGYRQPAISRRWRQTGSWYPVSSMSRSRPCEAAASQIRVRAIDRQTQSAPAGARVQGESHQIEQIALHRLERASGGFEGSEDGRNCLACRRRRACKVFGDRLL